MLSNRDIKILAGFSILALVGYFEVRVFYFIVFSYSLFERLLALALLLGEGHAIHHAWGFMLDIINLQRKKYKIPRVKLNKSNLPWVAVLVPARNEPIEVVEQTMITLFGLDYANKNIYLLDGSDEDSYSKSYKKMRKNMASNIGTSTGRRTQKLKP